ncbi:MAG: Glu/Leu/Phe/Val dehydrogenase [Chloroflexota bacterium]|nr:Glu/Leu/Phe/Val dehydrogenase [Chloroflexota bacterium]MDE2940884.1 Glu/Leu/Phe/Val dehydrogenase [Chloroflexota bacterium]MDE3268415.1 Glu/Leu/Phe/Val dehydrogenase [Chloroflexota bacterium]
MNVTDYMEAHGHEQLSVYTDPEAGLRAFIAIHDTTLGPAVGGVRIWPHRTEQEAIVDVLRLARGMTYKSAAAGLNMGGGKALIIASAQDKSEAMMRAFGRFVDTLGGRYVTTEDVGATLRDLEHVAQETEYVVGLPVSQGGSGDPSIMTAFGIYRGMKACALDVWGSESLEGRTVALQGFGKVATRLAGHLTNERARLVVSEIDPAGLERARQANLETLDDPSAIYDQECDIFAPCALGGILNDDTIPRLRCRIVAGAANNQLLEDRHSSTLQSKGILYAPDYIINAGGVINISLEMEGEYDETLAAERTGRIYDTLQQVMDTARSRDITTAQAADRLAEERIEAVRRVKRIYL